MQFRRLLLGFLALAVFSLSACSGKSAQEEIYDHLEKAVSLEDGFREQQDPLVDLENKENKLYNQIVDLSMDKFDKIKDLSKQASEIVDKRKEKLELEKESIDAAKEEFDKIKPLISEIDEDKKEAKENAKDLYKTMQDRYDAYQNLYSSYKDSLKLDSALYDMLQNKDLKEEDLQKQIEKINNNYDKVTQANKKFNQYTEEYNQLKKDFYKSAGMKVTYEESSNKSEKNK